MILHVVYATTIFVHVLNLVFKGFAIQHRIGVAYSCLFHNQSFETQLIFTPFYTCFIGTLNLSW